MNIFLDSQPLLGTQSGIGRYVKSLLSIYQNDDDINILLCFNNFFNKKIFSSFGSKYLNQAYPYKIIRRLLIPNYLYEFPYDQFKINKADIFHGTNFIYFPTVNSRSVITIHDLAFLKYPETTSEKIYKHHSKWVPYSAHKCDHIIADSAQTKQDIIEMLNIPDSKVTTIPLAADDQFQVLDREIYVTTNALYHLPERYILFVGTLEPRKNLLGLLHSYILFRKNSSSSEKLVIIGAKGWKYDPIFDFIRENNLESEVVFLGYVNDEHLPAIYNGSTIFVMPSLYEGFGIPILEAMGCGVPVIGSNVSSIPEVIDRYGTLLPPDDYEGWGAAMDLLLSDQEKHSEFSALSLERASHFSWKRTAELTKQVYLDVLKSR